MKKLLSKAITVALFLAPGIALAAYDDVQLGVTDTVLSVNSATVTVKGTASTTVESITVDSTSFDITFVAGSIITVSAPDLSVTALEPSQSVSTDCASSVRTTTITASVAGSATIQPSATACSTSSSSGGGGGTVVGLIGGGGGGGGGTAIIPTVAAPATAPVASPSSGSTSSVTFTSDLEMGAENSDVAALQAFLASKGFLTMPTGVPMGYFGSLTKSALAKFQAANDISPAVGYFGPKTRVAVNSGGAAAPAPAVSTGTPAASGSFTRDLEVGATGADVKQLQVFLNTHGYVVAESGPGSPGNETERVGALTRTALAKFQDANGITPAVGYFGPKTRAAVNAMMDGN